MATKSKPLSDDELVAVINQEKYLVETDTLDQVAIQRINGNFAYVKQFTPETTPTTGMSSVLDSYVTPCVDILTTYMTKVFCSDKETVVFNPMNPELSDVAKQATKMVNAVVHKMNPGYFVLNRGFKDAALNKNAIFKVTWDEVEEVEVETFTGLSEEEMLAIISAREEAGYEAEVLEESSESTETTVQVADPLTGQMIEQTQETEEVSWTVRFTFMKGMPKIENIPPEEFLINEGTTKINGSHLTRWVAHRKLMYFADIVELFPEVNFDHIGDGITSELEYDYEKQARHDWDGTYETFRADSGTEDTKQYEVTECWVRAHRKGGKPGGWRHCFVLGNDLLFDEEWMYELPFASYAFFPIPHKFYALSVPDKLRQYEMTATGLLRGEIDMRNQQNTFRLIADPRHIDQRDLQSGRPGIIKAKPGFDASSVMPLPSPTGAGNTPAILEYVKQKVIGEIGIDPISGQISVDVEKSGNDATKTAMVIDNASARIESYAREFADHTLRDIIWLVTGLLVQNKDHPSVIELAEAVTPGEEFALGQLGVHNILAKNDLSAKVGLGHMSGPQKVAAAQSLMQIQTQLDATPSMAMYKLGIETAKGWGYENPETILGTEEEFQQKMEQFQQTQQSAQEAQAGAGQAAQQQAQTAQAQFQAQMELATQDQQFRHQLAQAQHDADLKEKQAKAEETLAKASKLTAETDKIIKETQLADQVSAENLKVNI